jgi:PAS domain-containing protein
MPPGWDGIETILNIWKEFSDVQMVICTAYSDYSWDQIAEAVGSTDSVLILKKPFDSVEVLQIAHALTRKWQLSQAARRHVKELDELVVQRTAELRDANEKLKREIGERAAVEEALRRSEERFSKAFQASPLPMCIQNSETGAFVDANTSYQTLVGIHAWNCLLRPSVKRRSGLIRKLRTRFERVSPAIRPCADCSPISERAAVKHAKLSYRPSNSPWAASSTFS